MKYNYLHSARNVLFLALALLLSGCSTYSLNQSSSLEALEKSQAQYTPIKQGQLEYYQFGHGSPIVLISGYAMDASSWNRRFLAVLAEQHQVIVFNNRNMGKSFSHSTHNDSKDLANDTHQLIQHLHLIKPAVVGISMGGMIAQQLAVLYPDELGELILINTVIAGKQAVHPDAYTEKMIWNMPRNKLKSYFLALDLFFPPSWKVQMSVALVKDRFKPENETEINPATISYQRQLVMKWVHDNATAKKISRLSLPVLILNGESDSVFPPINSLILARSIHHAKLVRWKEGGHGMIYQYPVELANTVNQFISQASN